MGNKIHNFVPGTPVERNIETVRNDTFSPEPIIGWNDDGTPYDFTGHTFQMQVKESREDGAEVILDIADADFTITQNSVGADAGVNNVVELHHDKSNMDIEAKDYVYDIEMTDASGKTYTIYWEKQDGEGYFRVKQDVAN